MAELSKSTLGKLQKEYGLETKESLAEMGDQSKRLYLGIPKESAYQERRISLTPNSVASLVNRGHRVIIESGAGDDSSFSDKQYMDVGADIVFDKERVFDAHVLLKSAPIMNEEISLLQQHQVIFSPILLPQLNKDQLVRIMHKKVTAIAFEYIKNDYGTFPFIRTLSEIAGNYAILVAARYLSNEYGKGILLGSIAGHPPTKVVIIGAGAVGEASARAAIGLGATVQIFDDNIHRLRRIQNNIGHKVYTSVLDPFALRQKISRAHVVIGAMHAKEGRTPCIVTDDMVASMKKGAVIIDVSIDHGGCFETSKVTSHKNPTYIVHDVLHYCVPNIASAVSRTASYAISNILSPILKSASRVGGIEKYLNLNPNFRHGAYLYKGALTKEHLSKRFELKYTDLDLLLSANF